jgi:hypothetical protein
MSRSIVARAGSARGRLFSIRSAPACSRWTPRNRPAFSAFTRLDGACSTMPRALAAAAAFCPEATSRTASRLCSNAYRRRVNFSIALSSSRSQQPAKRDVFRGKLIHAGRELA